MARPIDGEVKGGPYQGTHTLGNWESDNAVDIYADEGTPVYATTFGRIGPSSQYGALNSSNPRMAGLRLHLISDTGAQEFYYAHLSKIIVPAGAKVKAGQLIGYSGSANGVAHLHFATRKGSPYDYTKGKAPKEALSRNPPSAVAEPPSADVVEPPAAPEVIPPATAPPPLPGPGAPQVNLEPPGSVVYTRDRPWVNQTWQRLAQTNPASQPLQQFAFLSGLGMEDNDA